MSVLPKMARFKLKKRYMGMPYLNLVVTVIRCRPKGGVKVESVSVRSKVGFVSRSIIVG